MTTADPAPDDRDSLEALFAEAVDLEPGARARVLDERCAGQPGLRQDVESLLAAHDRRGPLDAILLDPPPPADSRIGRTIGHFRLLDEIGRGGMGVVYRAERSDGQFAQRVAIKLIHPGPRWATDAETLRRYRAERQILASLNHPHIVTLLDAGLTEDGQAYLVMEEVDGEPITQNRERTLTERLRLFQDVCAAVHYAHQHSVVHRDLKPANIFVTRDGVVKVLDFGVAKLLDETVGDEDRTAAGAARPLTPGYASPEQLRGLPVTTACDVYALGVVLYELVTGSRPYDTKGLTLDQVVALVSEREPTRPSARVVATGAPAPSRSLIGDIDAIVLKAMHKEPAERYASAQALAEDLSRHLAGQPILAREPSLGYLAAKLARRHKGAFVFASIALIALAIALGVSLYETRVAVAARTRADARFADVRQLANSLIFKVQDDVQGLPGSTPVRKTIIAEALAYLERLSRDPAGDDGLRLDLAAAYHRVGRVQGLPSAANLGDREGALQSFRKAIELLRPLAIGPKARHDAAIALGRVDLDFATTVRLSSHQADADPAVREAGTIADAWLARDPGDVEARRLRGSVYFAQAAASQDSLPIWQHARETFGSLLVEQPDNPDYMRNVALVEKYMGEVCTDHGDLRSALAHHGQALELDQRRLARLPNSRMAQMDVALDLSNLARAQWQSGHDEEAVAGYERSLALRQQIADADPQDAYARGRVAFAHTMLAKLYADLHRLPEALAHAREAVHVQETLASQGTLEAYELARYLNTLGMAQQESGQHAAACQTWRRAASIMTPLRPASDAPSTPHIFEVRSEIDALDQNLASCGAVKARPRS